MAVPSTKIIAQLILKAAAATDDAKKIARSIADQLVLHSVSRLEGGGAVIHEVKLDIYPARLRLFNRRFRAAKNSLIKAGLIVSPGPGRILITEAGRAVLAAWEAAM